MQLRHFFNSVALITFLFTFIFLLVRPIKDDVKLCKELRVNIESEWSSNGSYDKILKKEIDIEKTLQKSIIYFQGSKPLPNIDLNYCFGGQYKGITYTGTITNFTFPPYLNDPSEYKIITDDLNTLLSDERVNKISMYLSFSTYKDSLIIFAKSPSFFGKLIGALISATICASPFLMIDCSWKPK